MTAKQILINRLKVKLEEAQAAVTDYADAIAYNSKLPDSFFENLFDIKESEITPIQNCVELKSVPLHKKVQDDLSNNSDYGRNKRLIIEILQDEGKAILKSEIVSKFEAKTGLNNQKKVVTNAIAALSGENSLMGYKPTGMKFRGNYWALATWMESDNKIKEEYEPKILTKLERIMNTA